ncbi:hypothetical protein FJZ19_01420 [Candidatus Pacearchaeota archaeon]|nr:hypothetical protein [Candidatus Pacearchaeota archaeon]
MMNQAERIEAMERLPEHLGEFVSVIFVNQFNKRKCIRGKLKEVTPYSNVVVTHLERVPEEIQDMDIFQGRKIMKSTTGIPFLGLPDAIMSIHAKDGSVLYDNELVHPFYNPHFFPNRDENGRLRIGEDHNDGKAYAERTRELSFGRR